MLVAVIVVMLIGVIKGYRRGFLRLAVWLLGLVGVIFIVTKTSPALSEQLINNSPLYEKVQQKIINVYNEQARENQIAKENETEKSDDINKDSISETPDSAVKSLGLPEIISSDIIKSCAGEMYQKLAATLFEEFISVYLAKLVIKAGSFVGLFALLGILMCILFAAVKIIEKIPVLKTFNRLLGVGAGLSISLILIWVFFLAIMMLFGNSLGSWLITQVQGSKILAYLFNNNILFSFI